VSVSVGIKIQNLTGTANRV